MVRGLFVQRSPSQQPAFEKATQRDLLEVTPTKWPPTQIGEPMKSLPLIRLLEKILSRSRYCKAGCTAQGTYSTSNAPLDGPIFVFIISDMKL